MQFYNKDKDVFVTIRDNVLSANWHPTMTDDVKSAPVLYFAFYNMFENTMTFIAEDRSIIAKIKNPIFDDSCKNNP